MFTLAAKLRCLPYLKWVHMFDCVSEGVNNILDLFFTAAVWTHFMFFLLIFVYFKPLSILHNNT